MAYRASIFDRISKASKTLRKKTLKLLQPRWLRKTSKSIQKSVKSAEKQVVKTTKKAVKASVGKTAESIQKSVKKAETQVAKSTRKVTKDVSKSIVGQTFRALGASLKKLGNSLKAFAIAIYKMFVGLAELIVPKPIRDAVSKASKRVGKSLQAFVVFVTRWFKTRTYWQLLGGAPAIVMAIPLSYFLARIPFYDNQAKANHYRNAAYNAYENDEFETADVLYKKLDQLGGVNDAAEFHAANSQYENGEIEAAIARFKRIAPEDIAQYAPAHAMLAKWYLEQSVKHGDVADRLAAIHIGHSLTRDPVNAMAHVLSANRNLRQGDTASATKRLEKIAKDAPLVYLLMAEVYMDQGNSEKAREQLKRLITVFKDREASNSLGDFDRLALAKAYTYIGELKEAQRLYDEGGQTYSFKPMERDRAVQEILAMAQLSKGRSKEAATRYVDYLERAHQVDADNRQVLETLANTLRETGHLGEAGRAAIEKIKNSPSPPGIFWSITGTVFAELGDYDEAIQYLEKGVKFNPEDALTLNNAAWVRLQTKKKIENALSYIERAIAIEPDRALFRETRGQIRFALQQWEGAIADLEFAINGSSQPQLDAHSTLATIYQKINMPSLAESHRRIADGLRVQQ